jgi:hypothetical protein
MHDTTDHPAALTETLARMGLCDLLTGYVAPERVRRWGFLAVERFVASHGYEFKRRADARSLIDRSGPGAADRHKKRRGSGLRQPEEGVSGPLPDGDVLLTPRAEESFRRECERVGGYEVDPDEAAVRSAAANFWLDCQTLLEAVIA